MKDPKLENLILEYLEDDTSAERKAELKTRLVQAGYDLNELSLLKNISDNMNELPSPEPSEKMDENFYKMLNNYKSDSQQLKYQHHHRSPMQMWYILRFHQKGQP